METTEFSCLQYYNNVVKDSQSQWGEGMRCLALNITNVVYGYHKCVKLCALCDVT